MTKKTLLLLILILILAFALRFYRVTEIPPSLNWDEVSIGYNAYSILRTGKDEWGQTLPVHFKSYGEYKLPAQIYASIPAIAVFGLNDFGVRITPVVYGTLTVLLLFFLTRIMFKNDPVALLSSFFLAVSFWHIHLTRASFESSFAVFWFVLGLWLLIKGFEQDKIWWFVAMMPFAISVYTYNTTRVFTPLFLLLICIFYRKIILKYKKKFAISFLIFVVLMLPFLGFMLSGEGSARFKLVSVTDDPGLNPRINERRGESGLPQPLPVLIHNKVTYVSYYFLSNYMAHFTPDFLFINGASHKQHHVQGVGELLWIQAPLLAFGAYWLLKNRNKYKIVLATWLLLAFIPVSITQDSIPHALRTLIAAPIYQIISAIGLFYLFELLKQQRLKAIVLLIFMVAGSLNFYTYLWNYYYKYPLSYSRDWQYGNREVVDYVSQNYYKYDQIVFSRHYGEPHMFTLFYLNYDPSKFQNDPNLVRFETHDWVRVLKFDKFYFPDLGDDGTRYRDIIGQNPGKRILFIGKGGDFPEDINKLKTIYFMNGIRAFEIVEKT